MLFPIDDFEKKLANKIAPLFCPVINNDQLAKNSIEALEMILITLFS